MASYRAYDPDGDSLVYSLASCMQGATTPVTYNPGYSPQQPLGATWQASMDPVSGS
ncbi:MAG: hypothetical protein R3B47_06695 [Bacteroidia bacterium]